MAKIDLKKTLKEFYAPSAKQPSIVDVPAWDFLMIDGAGNPNGPAYQQAVEALYSVAYATKFMIKKGPEQIDYAVMPLEGLWWADDPTAFTQGRKDEWLWTSMIMQPDIVTAAHIEAARQQTAKKKGSPGPRQITLRALRRGQSCTNTLSRSLRRRRPDHRRLARLHHRPGIYAARQTSRNIFGRPAAHRPGKPQDGSIRQPLGK